MFTAGSAWIVDLAPPDRRGRVIGLYGLAVWAGLSVGPLLGELLQHASGYTAGLDLRRGGAAGRRGDRDSACPTPSGPSPEHERHPLIAREALRPGVALALASIGYATRRHLRRPPPRRPRGRPRRHRVRRLRDDGRADPAGRRRPARPDRPGPRRDRRGDGRGAGPGRRSALAQSLEVALVGALAMGAAFSLLYPSLSLIVVGRVPETRRGAALGTFTAFFDAGVGLGAPLAGLAAALTSYEGAFLFAACSRSSPRRRSRLDRGRSLSWSLPAEARRARAGYRSRAAGSGRRGRCGRRSSERTDSAVPIPLALRQGDGVDADPLALRHPLEVDGEVDVDEEVAAPVEHGADAVADVGGDQRALQGRGLLAGDERVAHPHPDGRRPRLQEPAARSPPLHRRVVADRLAGGEELGFGALLRARRRRGLGRLPPAPRLARSAAASPAPAPAHRSLLESEASTSCTRRPGRTTSASTRTGPIGTDFKISKVTRPT